MDVLSTTNPPAPTGVSPTEVPLGINSAISETPIPVNFPLLKNLAMFNVEPRGAYLGSFVISQSDPIGSRVFDWDMRFPTEIAAANLYQNVYRAEGKVTMPRIWELLTYFYSMQCKVEFDLEFIPVKTSDCRFSLDLVVNQNGSDLTSLTYQSKLVYDSVHHVLDDQDTHLRISVPTFWLTDNVASRTFPETYDVDNNSNVKNPYIPFTRIQAFIRNPYQPNMIQLDYFRVVVILHPKVLSPVGLAGYSPVLGFNSLGWPEPWVTAGRISPKTP